MSFELSYRNIKRELIQSFAHAYDWIDHLEKLESQSSHSNREVCISWLKEMTELNQRLLNSISDYRVTKEHHLLKAEINHELLARLMKVIETNQHIPNSEMEPDCAKIRSALRDQLYESLLFLEQVEKGGQNCILAFRGDPGLELDVFNLVYVIASGMKDALNRISQSFSYPAIESGEN